MVIIIGSFFWILGLIVIFNPIESRAQSEKEGEEIISDPNRNTGKQDLRRQAETSDRYRRGIQFIFPKSFSGVPKQVLKDLELMDEPIRKVRCPTIEQRTEHTTFMVMTSSETYEECTPDKVLLAVGPVIYGHISEHIIRPICSKPGSIILYDERDQKHIQIDITYLRKNFGVLGSVPSYLLEPDVYPFGVFEDDIHDLGSASSSRQPTRPRKNFFGRIFGSSSSGSRS